MATRSFNCNLFVGSGVLVFCNLVATAQQEQVKPNVVLIVTDDQGSIDLNCYGASDLKTPNLDQLAKEGIRFTQFYSGSAICSPSRASILTGKTPQSAGLPNNASSEKGKPGMPGSQVTIAEMLKEAGYVTAHVGKWHIGFSSETMPLGQGFDYSFGHMGGCIDNYSHFFYWNGPNRHDLWENGVEVFYDGQFFPDLMVEKAETFIKKNKQSPFFLYLAFNTPHYPVQPEKKWREYYKNLDSPRREYAGFISSTDERIGRIIQILDDEELRENTIIIFLSDQGHSYEERTGYGGGCSGPFRGGKFSLFEGGIRVPAIISWKKTLPESKINSEIGMAMDILPTIADFCGIENPPVGVEGKSLKNMILESKKSSSHEVIYWQLGKQWAIRKGDWKLICNPLDPSPNAQHLLQSGDSLFLVNMVIDISESRNFAIQNPEKISELIQEYKSILHRK